MVELSATRAPTSLRSDVEFPSASDAASNGYSNSRPSFSQMTFWKNPNVGFHKPRISKLTIRIDYQKKKTNTINLGGVPWGNPNGASIPFGEAPTGNLLWGHLPWGFPHVLSSLIPPMGNYVNSLYKPETDSQTQRNIGAKSDVSVGTINRTHF